MRAVSSGIPVTTKRKHGTGWRGTGTYPAHISPVADLPGVGGNLQDHPVAT
jgi:hypothetical protein